MGQLGFFDADKRLEVLSARGDPLEAIDHLVRGRAFAPQSSRHEDGGVVCSVSTEAVGGKEAGKTIENRTQPELVPNQTSKSTIVRGALMPSSPQAAASPS
jgi:hypothetical protein